MMFIQLIINPIDNIMNPFLINIVGLVISQGQCWFVDWNRQVFPSCSLLILKKILNLTNC